MKNPLYRENNCSLRFNSTIFEILLSIICKRYISENYQKRFLDSIPTRFRMFERKMQMKFSYILWIFLKVISRLATSLHFFIPCVSFVCCLSYLNYWCSEYSRPSNRQLKALFHTTVGVGRHSAHHQCHHIDRLLHRSLCASVSAACPTPAISYRPWSYVADCAGKFNKPLNLLRWKTVYLALGHCRIFAAGSFQLLTKNFLIRDWKLAD